MWIKTQAQDLVDISNGNVWWARKEYSEYDVMADNYLRAFVEKEISTFTGYLIKKVKTKDEAQEAIDYIMKGIEYGCRVIDMSDWTPGKKHLAELTSDVRQMISLGIVGKYQSE